MTMPAKLFRVGQGSVVEAWPTRLHNSGSQMSSKRLIAVGGCCSKSWIRRLPRWMGPTTWCDRSEPQPRPPQCREPRCTPRLIRAGLVSRRGLSSSCWRSAMRLTLGPAGGGACILPTAPSPAGSPAAAAICAQRRTVSMPVILCASRNPGGATLQLHAVNTRARMPATANTMDHLINMGVGL
jgi:hypothetical protein